MATWANTTLCTIEDVRKKLPDFEIPTQESEDGSGRIESMVQDAIDAAKEEIRDHLQVSLVKQFHDKGGAVIGFGWPMVRGGYSYDSLDTMTDKINNPEVLTRPAVYLTIVKLLELGVMRFNARWQENAELLDVMMTKWRKEYTTSIADQMLLLKFDLNADGVIDDSERVQVHRFTLSRI